MDRRNSLKTLLVGTIGGVTVASTGIACNADTKEKIEDKVDNLEGLYGRTPSEIEWDKKVSAETYFNKHEMATIAVLSDIILPKTETAGSATEAEVPDFIEFIVKDLPSNQLPLRGGLMWLDLESNKRFNNQFISCSSEQQIQIIDDIAYPTDPTGKTPETHVGKTFFNHLRNLVTTGYYTTRIGFNDLGYKGNTPNVWDGVPPEVLKEHDVDYDPAWIAKCVDQSKRGDIAEWDDDGNLLT